MTEPIKDNFDDSDKLEVMSDLQRAILAQLIPLAPRAMHSEFLREAVAPFLQAKSKKEQRREFEAAVTPLVKDGFIKYFCCFIDSYAMNPQRISIVSQLDHSSPERK